MTFKKSMISISAAAVIAAGLTGCGSSGTTAATTTSSSSSSSTTTTTAPTSFQAVDGKIMNATATAYYVDENNVTQSITLDQNKTYTDVVSGTASKGQYTFTLPEANASLASSIRYVEINGTSATVASGKSYPATFIDVDGSGDYNASVDQVFTGQLIAPKGGAYATPISTMVYSLVGASAMTAADFNQTDFDNKLAVIAARLNLSADDIKNIDPMAEGKSEFKAINAYLGGTSATAATMATIATALNSADTNSTDFAGVVSYLSTNLPAGTAKNIFTAVDSQLDAGTLKVADLASINVDKTRENSGTPVLETASTTAIGDINSTKVDTVDVASLINTGAKIKTGTVVMTFDAGESTDANATGTVDLYLSVSAPEARIESTDSESKLVIKVSDVDVTRTSGTTVLDINTSKAKTSYEWYIDDATSKKNYLSSTDVNDTHIDLDGVFSADNTIKLGTLISNVESNISSTDNNGSYSFTGKIANMTAIIVDSNGLLQQVDSDGNAKLWSTATVAGTGNALTAEGKSLINAKVDMRGADTNANAAPSLSTANGQAAGSTVVVDYANSAASSNASFTVLTSTDTNEANESITISGLPSWMTVATATLVTNTNASTTTNSVDFNVTTDTNQTIGDTNTTVSFKVTDEFGKANTVDGNVSYLFNAYPVVSVTTNPNSALSNFTKVSSTQYTVDVNLTKVANSDIVFKVTNMMGEANTTMTADLNASLSVATEINATTGIGSITFGDVNATNAPVSTAKKITINEALGSLSNVTVDFNTSL